METIFNRGFTFFLRKSGQCVARYKWLHFLWNTFRIHPNLCNEFHFIFRRFTLSAFGPDMLSHSDSWTPKINFVSCWKLMMVVFWVLRGRFSRNKINKNTVVHLIRTFADWISGLRPWNKIPQLPKEGNFLSSCLFHFSLEEKWEEISLCKIPSWGSSRNDGLSQPDREFWSNQRT